MTKSSFSGFFKPLGVSSCHVFTPNFPCYLKNPLLFTGFKLLGQRQIYQVFIVEKFEMCIFLFHFFQIKSKIDIYIFFSSPQIFINLYVGGLIHFQTICANQVQIGANQPSNAHIHYQFAPISSDLRKLLESVLGP